MSLTPLTAVLALFGFLILGASLFGFVYPSRLCRFINSAWRKPSLLYVAVGVRLALGVVLILAASDTKFPRTFQVLGWIAIVAAFVIPIVGRERIGRVLEFFASAPSWVVRLWLCLGLAFGGFVLYGVL